MKHAGGSITAISQRNAIALIPRERLEPGTTYTVSVTALVDGKDWKRTWSFTTAPKQHETLIAKAAPLPENPCKPSRLVSRVIIREGGHVVETP